MRDYIGLVDGGPDAEADVRVSYSIASEASDAPESTNTKYSISVGDTFVGALGSIGDRDVIAVYLTAGESYDIDLLGRSLYDPKLRLYDSSGALIAVNDDSSSNTLNAQIKFTAPSSATYYLSAGSYLDFTTGTYALSVEIDYSEIKVSDEQFAEQLTDGYWEAFGSLRASWDVAPGGSLSYNVDGLTADGRNLAQQALLAWTLVTGIDFVRVTGSADITFEDEDTGAYTSSSAVGGEIVSAEVNVDKDWISAYGASLDSYSFQTYIHEIGHALGLGHAGDYNGNATYGVENDFANDSWQESIMSYFPQDENPTVDADFAFVVTPMKADIIAMQEMYGTAGTLRTGDTTYGFNGNTGTYLDDIVTMAQPVAFTIYDDGGFDTLDLSGTSRDQYIDLRVGARSDVLGLTGNMTIADGTRIELVLGGSGADEVYGSKARNKVDGGRGDDKLWGNNGGDRLDGGGGADYLDGGGAADRLYGDGGQDTLYGGNGNDYLWGNGSDDLLYGGDMTDVMIGGNGADTLYGELGADTLKGGRGDGDLLYGGVGDDVFVFRKSYGADTIADFGEGGDVIEIQTGAGTFGDLTIVEGADGAVVTFAKVTITVTGAAAADLDASDFLFT